METFKWLRNKAGQAETYLVDVLRGWSPAHVGDLSGRVYMVTGCNSGIGFQTARKLAENNARVFMVVRSGQRGQLAVNNIRAENKTADLVLMECDMHKLENVHDLVQDFLSRNERLDCLICNAGVFHPGPFSKTEDGLEQTLAINYYAPALMTLGLLPRLRENPGSRVIWETSPAEQQGKLDFSNLRGNRYRASGLLEYGTSKLYMIMFCREISVRVPEVDFFCVQPGLVLTPLQIKVDRRYWTGTAVANAALLFGQAEYHGSYSTIFASTDPSLTGMHYSYIGPNFIGAWHTASRTPQAAKHVSYFSPPISGATEQSDQKPCFMLEIISGDCEDLRSQHW